jgi:hypothetical protein
MELGEIYCLTSPSGKKYIGQCVKLLSNGKNWGAEKRWKQHIRDATNGKDYCRLLNNAIRKYTPEKIMIEILQECNINELDKFEIEFITNFNTMSPNGYNLTSGGKCNSRQSEETKKLKSESCMGKNKGRDMEKRERLRPEDKDLPKYVSSYKNKEGKEGYKVQNHPQLKFRSFTSKKLSMEEKLKLVLEYLKTAEN